MKVEAKVRPREELSLRVAEAFIEDVGKGFARVDTEELKSIGAVPGDLHVRSSGVWFRVPEGLRDSGGYHCQATGILRVPQQQTVSPILNGVRTPAEVYQGISRFKEAA